MEQIKTVETGLVKYDSMCRAIAACHRVDEVLDIRNKAKALEAYAKIALDVEEERRVREVRLRAERRTGELLKETKRATGGQPYQKKNPTGIARIPVETKTLSEMGISKVQSVDWQEMADLPQEEFEKRIKEITEMPTTDSILGRKPKPLENDVPIFKGHVDVLDLWGFLCRLERNKYLEKEPQKIADLMTPSNREDIARIAPAFIAWLQCLMEIFKNEKSQGSERDHGVAV